MPLPSAPFDPSLTIFNGLSIIQLRIGEQTYIYEATQLEDDPEQESKPYPRPDRKGRLRTRRIVQTKHNERWTYALDEVKRLLEIFGGHLSGRTDAKATIWIPDVDDADTKCALKSEDDFEVSITRDGKLAFGNSDYSKTSIRIESLEDHAIVWTKDAVIPE